MDDKARIRKDILSIRDALDPASRSVKDNLIKERLFSLPQFQQAEALLFFASFRSEVSTYRQMEESLRLGKRVLVPRVDPSERKLRLYEITGLFELVPGYMEIPEPHVPGERLRDVNDADIVLMPGAAFDPAGNRLGYGGGYYDKLLSGLRKEIPLIALAYEEQILDSVPSEGHDIKVHLIVTDKRVLVCAGN